MGGTRTESIQDPNIPVESLAPIELIEVDDDEAEQPPESWGQDGQGGEDEGGDGAEPVDQTAPAEPDGADDTGDAGAEATGGAV